MLKTGYIALALWLCLAFSAAAQPVIDTVCTDGGVSHLGVAYQAGVSYDWKVGGGAIISKPDSSEIEILWANQSGQFLVEVLAINENGCTDSSVGFVFLVSPNGAPPRSKRGFCRGTRVVLVPPFDGSYYLIGDSAVSQLAFTAISDTSFVVIQPSGVCGSDTIFQDIKVSQPPSAWMNTATDTLMLNDLLKLKFQGPQTTEVDWYLDSTFSGSGRMMEFQFSKKGKHTITQIATENGCTDTLRKTVFVWDDYKIFIPNAFTPTADNVNDLWKFDGEGIQSFTAEIFNRWGEKIYEWDNNTPVHGWDGTNSGQPSPQGVYVYVIIAEDLRGGEHRYTGQFSLVR